MSDQTNTPKMPDIIKLDKEASKRLQFVQAATSKQQHTIFSRISANGDIVGADGLRLHAIRETGNVFFDDLVKGVVEISKIKAGANYIEPVMHEDEQDRYPEYHQAIPKLQNGIMISINPRFLKEVCQFMDSDTPLHIMIRGDGKPIEIKGTCQGEDAYALIMPMNYEYGKEGYFKKYAPEAEKED
jgi:hypothetical protein